MLLKYFNLDNGDKLVYSGSFTRGNAQPVATFNSEGDAIKFIDAASWASNDAPQTNFTVVRRERIATQVLSGFFASWQGGSDDYTPEGATHHAVKFADALIAELDKTGK